MSNNLNSLLARVAKSDPALAADLRREMDHLAKRREFGLNFEKHRPETVELHGRRIRVGDKVRFLAARGSVEPVRRDVWLVHGLSAAAADQETAVADLVVEHGDETTTRALQDLVAVADFRDPIYPGLTSTGTVQRGGDRPYHAVINSENYHALEAMLFTSQAQVDVIYIDPPYNIGATDWKYNNDYVDSEDRFRHSKWLSFIERRLKLAKKLLNPSSSVLIVTIDEKEYLRLGLLLEQTFPGAGIQMVSSVINPAGAGRAAEFSRTDEYIFFVRIGDARVLPEQRQEERRGVTYPDFADDCVAHVLGDRDTIEVASYTIPRVKPQDVQGSTHIRVLLAKDAVSTGWDCPRAEVLVSLRPAVDHTYITQLLGRMVRTPLARSTNDERLNSASCYLPHFDRPTAKRIAKEIMGIAGSGDAATSKAPTGPKVLFGPVDLTWNPDVPIEVGDFISHLPSLPKPAARPKPIKRLLQLTVALAQDKLAAHPNEDALEQLYAVLDGRMAQHKALIDAQAKAIEEAEIRRITATRGAEDAEEERDVRQADENTVKEAFSHTKRALTVPVANGYLRRLYEPAVQEDVLYADLTAIQARVAALSRITVNDQPVVVQAVEDAADALTRRWLDAHRTSVANLSEQRRTVYEEIRAQAREPEVVATELPTALRQEGADEDRNPLPVQPKHVLSTPAGGYPIDPTALNEWERAVIEQEISRRSVVGWYRNPSAAGKYSIRIPYKKNGEWSSLQPDFVFVDRNGGGDLVASLVDPHSGHLSDALDRLRGIADFTEVHGAAYARIDSLDTDKDKVLRVLDMKDPDTRKAVGSATTSSDLFNGPHARRY